MAGKTAILLGPTGLVGNYLLNLLLDDPDFSRIKIFHRRELERHHEKLEQYVIDMDKLHLVKSDFTGTDVFCCLGTTMRKAGSREAFRKVDYEYPLSAAKLALENEIPNFSIITAIGADPGSSIFYNKVKGEVEEEISQMPFQRTGIFRPSILDGDRRETRMAEQFGLTMMKIFSFLMVGKLNKYKPIHGKTVAKAMICFAVKDFEGLHIFESHEIKELAKQSFYAPQPG